MHLQTTVYTGVKVKLNTSLFDYAEKKGIIVNSYYLTPEYIPDELICRDDQIGELAMICKPIFEGDKPKHCLVLGPTGTGKTVVFKHVFKSLAARIDNDKIRLDALLKKKADLEANGKSLDAQDQIALKMFNRIVPGINIIWDHVSCKETSTPSGILHQLITKLDPYTKISRRGTPLDTLYNVLYDLMRTKNVGLIVALDEIDFLKDDSLIYNLSRAAVEEKLIGRQFITVIGLSNNIRYDEKLDERVKSSTTFEKIYFPPYTVTDIYHIINARAEIALEPESYDYETIEACAKKAYDSGGDVRIALKVIKAAAELAEQKLNDKINVDDIYAAQEMVLRDELVRALLQLTTRQQLVLLAVLKLKQYNIIPTSGQVTDVYVHLCKYISLDTHDLTVVPKSINILELLGIVNTQSSHMGRKGGNTRLINVREEDRLKIAETIYGDGLLFKDLMGYNPIEDHRQIIYESNKKRGWVK
jgi:cell division control protein 6